MQIDALPVLTLLHHPNGETAAVYEQIHALNGPGIFKDALECNIRYEA